MKRIGWLSLAGLVALALSSLLSPQEQEVTLRFKFPVKQVRHYETRVDGEMAMSMQMLGQETPFTLTFQGMITQSEKIEEVDKEGVATILMTTKGRVKTEATGLPDIAGVQPKEEIPPITVRLKVNPLGKVSEAKIEEGKIEAQSPIKLNLQVQDFAWQGLLLPEKPVRIGDTWDISTTISFPVPDPSGAMVTKELELKGKARLVAFEKVDGQDCAVIEKTVEIPDFGDIVQAFPIPEGKAKISGHSEGRETEKIWFDIANGLIVKGESTVDVNFSLTISLPTGQSISMSSQGIFRSQQKLTKVTQAEIEEK